MSAPGCEAWSSREYAQRKVVDLAEYRARLLAEEIFALDVEDSGEWLEDDFDAYLEDEGA